MRAHPLLNMANVTPDPELLGKLPPTLALYYMAVPVASEDGQVSVAMTHPENATALAVLSGLLGSRIVPVRGAAGAIRTILHTLPAAEPMPGSVLGWKIGSNATPAVAAWTQALSAALDAPATLLETPDATFDKAMPVGCKERYRLTVLDLVPEPTRTRVLRQMTGPLFFVGSRRDQAQEREMVRPLRRILVALRGYSSDGHALEWATTLAADRYATLTLLPLAGERPSGLQAILAELAGHERRSQGCAGRRALDHPNTYVKVRQGVPLLRLGEEAAEGNYDLIIISAEGEGAFVGQVLAELERRQAHEGRPVMIVKPTL